MKKKLHIFLFLMLSSFCFSQVKDISFTFSPSAEYTWWDNQAGLKDGTLIGGKLGFGFGEFIELRATYSQSVDLKTNFDDYGISGFSNSMFQPRDINLSRWGGEFKANIGSGKLSPYLVVGTGVQNIEIEGGEEYEQIYTSLGLGIKTKLSDRIVFTVEGKNTLYNFNAGRYLLTDADKTNFGVTNADFSSGLLSNWSVQGALQFYLGGRKPGTLSELDRAYLQKFRGGFKGLRWVVEPSLNYMKFDDKSAFRDTWLLGGYAGLDFNQFTGIRFFYLHAMDDDQISTNFDKFSMYGLEFRARLNDGNGVTPYLILGGGYINTSSQYQGVNNVSVQSEEFASAGLGLNIPLSKNFLITGGARGILTSSQDVEDLSNPDQLQTHMMYNAGVKLTFGAKSKNPDDIYQSQMDTALERQDKISQQEFKTRLEQERMNNKMKLNKLQSKYQMQLDSLQVELEAANKVNNVAKAVTVLEQKEKTQKALNEVDEVVKKNQVSPDEAEKVGLPTKTVQPKELIKMTPAELELLIDRILDKTENPQREESSSEKSTMEQMSKRIEFLEKLYLERTNTTAPDKKKVEVNKVIEDKVTTNKMDVLKTQVESNEKKIEKLDAAADEKTKVVVVEKQAEAVPVESVPTEKSSEGFHSSEELLKELGDNSRSEKSLNYKGTSLFTGVNFGDQTAFNTGLRMNYGIRNTGMEFMPELYYGFSDPESFGISGNVVYTFNPIGTSGYVAPYFGIGAGVMKIDGDTNFNHNIIIGANLKIANGRLFTDFTLRDFFNNVQFAVGYRLPF
ncbi:hypothetical protein [Flavobacterium faecale]|uniref:hypothetical protein n=1 Tax=Flavobacterium faecale TaxID=1355330 RepID=UPI003AACDAB0